MIQNRGIFLKTQIDLVGVKEILGFGALEIEQCGEVVVLCHFKWGAGFFLMER